MLGEPTVSSPSRTYVAICVNPDDGHYPRRFTLPKEVSNDAQAASWFFLNRIDSVATIKGVVPNEDFDKVPEVSRESSRITAPVDSVGTKVRNAIARFFRPTRRKSPTAYAPIPQGYRRRSRAKNPLVHWIGR
jgi:hypothetical protein